MGIHAKTVWTFVQRKRTNFKVLLFNHVFLTNVIVLFFNFI
ncbi:hypothetical protein LEP1GSC125_3581 [Leptospira mayottensis 200901122]|uniref:Uncharacterized protein n=1 Tax=Leptospira mayottensis 200901122 TaxID=1193010 RepID=A0AA87MP97_9LEPT|nr:hypothetical protein LEP1GSC125_3581 [Leptospira mayottensis 200901122]